MAALKIYTDASYCSEKKTGKFASLFYVNGIKVYQYVSAIIQDSIIKDIKYFEALSVLSSIEKVRQNISNAKYLGITSIQIFNDNAQVKQSIHKLGLNDIVDRLHKQIQGGVHIHKISRENKHIKICDKLAKVNH